MTRPRGRFWSNIAAVAYKEAAVVRHDKALLATVFAQPVMMLLLFGLALSNEPANVPWAVLDQSPSSVSRGLVQEIQATGYFLPPRRVASYDEGQQLLQEGRALAFLVIPASFRRDVERSHPQVQLLLDGSDPLSAARVGSYIGQVAGSFEPRARPRSGSPSPAAPGLIDTRQHFRFNATLRDRNFFLAGLAGMLLTNLCFSATSGGLVAEREAGMFEQMLALPTTPLEVVLGKLVPYVVLAYIVLLFATIAPALLFGLWPAGSWLTLLLVSLPFILASLAVGVLVSVLAHTSAQAVFITVFFILPSFVLSGSMLPYQLMPHPVRELGGLFPLRWYQIILRRIIERGAGLGEVAVPALMLLLLFALLLTLIRWRMKPRLG
ncbi:MAG TPA: ABC transporter permease [Mycobacterium sp.]|nr:ABC transporter permease [Mycobacterium sp.]